MRFQTPVHLKEKLVRLIFFSIPSFSLAYFIDQYYILGKGWGFLLEWVK
ncbi:MAG: hypothetical protein US54_C0003G0019 [Candidatus Roizmanbacteria bacterium GW2011_GWA2_37_7]|uniref:Uncharacterized protein n=1 Tax=Candidatus Roizmanbacteria bacterium GW2011_GWA2_37_7 TaxID=1618481 RepID=A0A0G0KDX2_9BACT|nr:MAG: hypothetical protein US54_C0003G0019 [Candidatus Roizmanbacteria bacterium GW2011_GWA2_37_7]